MPNDCFLCSRGVGTHRTLSAASPDSHLDYYTATELVVLRTAEIEVFYEVKSGGSEKNNGRRFGRQQDKDLSRGSSPWISGNMV